MSLPAIQANLPVIPVHPEDLIPTWKISLQKITELVIQLLLPFIITIAFYALLPISFSAVVLPVITFGAVFASSFLFTSETEKVRPVTIAPLQAPAPVARPLVPPPLLPAEAPRGITNRGLNNCWVNSLTQLFRCDAGIMDWFQKFPDAIANFSNRPIFMPRECLFSDAEIALNPIQRVPFNAPTPRANLEVFKWITETPEFSLLNVNDLFSERAVAEMLPDNLFDRYPQDERLRRRQNAAELVASLRNRNREQKQGRSDAIEALDPQVLPADFETITPENRTAFRQTGDQRIIHWISRVAGLDLIHLNSLLSDQAIDLPDALFERFPEGAHADLKLHATAIIEKLRAIVEAEQLNDAEKQALLDKLQRVNRSMAIVALSEDKIFIQKTSAYRGTFDLIEYLKVNNLVDLPLDQIFTPDPLDGDVAEMMRTLEIRRMFPGYQALNREEKTMILDSARFYQSVARMTPLERENTLRYLTFFSDKEDPSSAVKFFQKYKNFFSSYENAKNGNLAVVQAASQELRLAFHQRYPLNNFNPNLQADPSEAFAKMEDLLPPELKVDFEVRRFYDTTNFGPMPVTDSCDGDSRKSREIKTPFLQIDILKDRPNLTAMLENYFDNRSEMGGTLRLAGADGVTHEYPIQRELQTFAQGPSSLWIMIKRFKFETPWDFFHWVLPSCFPAPAGQSTKLETPVLLPDTLDITTLNEGVVQYRLDGFIVHLGKSANSGHYVSYKREQNAAGESVWYEIDDSRVTKVAGDKLTTKMAHAYMPHYSRIQP